MMALTAMADFENADAQTPLQTYPPVTWEQVKAFLCSQYNKSVTNGLKHDE